MHLSVPSADFIWACHPGLEQTVHNTWFVAEVALALLLKSSCCNLTAHALEGAVF